MRPLLRFVPAAAQAAVPPPQNVLQLSATGTVEVQQDLLALTLHDHARRRPTPAHGADPAQEPRSTPRWPRRARPRSRASSTCAPATSASTRATRRDGKISGWQRHGRAGAGRPRLSAHHAGRRPHQTLTLGGVGFGLSREQRAKVEAEAQTQAIERFKQKAGELAKGFGFAGYTLREVSVNANDQGMPPRRA